MLPSGPHFLALSASTTQSNPVVLLALAFPVRVFPTPKVNGVPAASSVSRLNVWAPEDEDPEFVTPPLSPNKPRMLKGKNF